MNINEIKPIENYKKEFDMNLFKEKLFASWGSARDQFGVPNNHRLSEILYKSLYSPSTFKENEIIDRGGFGRTETLVSELPISNKNIPSLEEFSAVIVRALTSDIDFSENLYSEALETIEKMTKYGPVRIWTRGDVYGVDNYPGSAEQIKKVATAGLGKLRNQIALKTGVDRQDVLNVKAAEDKIPFIMDILKEFKGKKIKVAVLLDDQISNIESAVKEGERVRDIKIYPIWIHQKKDSTDDTKDAIKIVGQIKDVLNEIEDITKENKVGFIVDFDGVVVDDDKRMEAQLKSVYNKLKEKEWI